MWVRRPVSFQKMVGEVGLSSSDLWGYVDNARRVTPDAVTALSTSPQVGRLNRLRESAVGARRVLRPA
jgi:hypothetical protein